MFYINYRTGEKITNLFEQKKISSDEYFNIMEYLSIDTFKNFHESTISFIEITEKLSIFINTCNHRHGLTFLKNTCDIYDSLKKILFKDYIDKFADMIILSCCLNEESMKVINSKKMLYAVIEKVYDAEALGYEFNEKKLNVIKMHYERV
jgi:hypothetical protein